MPRSRPRTKLRSGCPLNVSVEILGDRWSLLIIRDMMLRGFRSYTQFLDSYERIATNILAHRLKKMVGYGIIATQQDPLDGRKLIYTLTLWNHRHTTGSVRRQETHLHSYRKRDGLGASPNRNGPLDRSPRRASKSRADSADQKRQTKISGQRPPKVAGKFVTEGLKEGNSRAVLR